MKRRTLVCTESLLFVGVADDDEPSTHLLRLDKAAFTTATSLYAVLRALREPSAAVLLEPLPSPVFIAAAHIVTEMPWEGPLPGDHEGEPA